MKKIAFIALLILTLPLVTFAQETPNLENQLTPRLQPLVAHGGGAIYGYRYTNSLEALNSSYDNGFRLIELDFSWTKDERPVLIHDWDKMSRRLFMDMGGSLTLEEFKSRPTFQDLTLMDLYDLSQWLVEHPDAFIITDVKESNTRALAWIRHYYPEMAEQIIPQIYSFDEYERVKNFGYKHIILTLYRSNETDEEILNFAEKNPLFAVTIPAERDLSSLPKELKALDIPVYAHTVNDLYVYEELQDLGVYGIYTDYFQPNYWISKTATPQPTNP